MLKRTIYKSIDSQDINTLLNKLNVHIQSNIVALIETDMPSNNWRSYHVFDTNLSNILALSGKEVHIYSDGADIRSTLTSVYNELLHVTFRSIKDGASISDMEMTLRGYVAGLPQKDEFVEVYTASIHNDIAKILGWKN